MAVDWRKIITNNDDNDYKNTNVDVGDLGGGSGSTFLRKDGNWATPTDTDTNTNQLTTFTLQADGGGGGTVSQGSTVDITGGTGISTNYSANTVSVSVTSGSIGDTQLAYDTGQNLTTSTNVQFAGVGIGTSGASGELRATDEVTAFYSDDRLKDKLGPIKDALDKVATLEGFYYKPNKTCLELGYKDKENVGLSAQKVQKILPHAVARAPIDDKYLTIKYDKVVPLLVNAINELVVEMGELEERLEVLEANN
tara:strand:+ start:14244 stop:15002 length:759 start_codon:yes stop_codon:yes gene_type:complete